MAAYLDNEDIADVLERVGELLEVQHANAYKVTAYRTAARTVRQSPQPMADILETEGLAGLEALRGIGKTIAQAIRELVETGRSNYLQRLQGQVSPEDLFMTVPGIGEKLAHRVHEALGVETLEELELAAHDGRLEAVPGVGARRARAIRDVLDSMLTRSSRRRARRIRGREVDHEGPLEEPSVELLLRIDEQYRVGAELGALRQIAPRRFNPAREAWLPILHADLEGWSFTALYSNTARAHELRATHDWVVIYFERHGHESQRTVVTETRSDLAGRRVVRGRERECREHYAALGELDEAGGFKAA